MDWHCLSCGNIEEKPTGSPFGPCSSCGSTGWSSRPVNPLDSLKIDAAPIEQLVPPQTETLF